MSTFSVLRTFSVPAFCFRAGLNDGFREQEPAWRERYGLTSVIFHPGWVVTDMGGEDAVCLLGPRCRLVVPHLNELTHIDAQDFVNVRM